MLLILLVALPAAAQYKTTTTTGGLWSDPANSVGQNHPNPFNPATVIEYQLPSGQTSGVLRIWDASGRMIDEFQLSRPSGSVVWDARGQASGVYLYQVGNQARKMALVK